MWGHLAMSQPLTLVLNPRGNSATHPLSGSNHSLGGHSMSCSLSFWSGRFFPMPQSDGGTVQRATCWKTACGEALHGLDLDLDTEVHTCSVLSRVLSQLSSACDQTKYLQCSESGRQTRDHPSHHLLHPNERHQKLHKKRQIDHLFQKKRKRLTHSLAHTHSL